MALPVTVDHLSKSYDDLVVLDEVSFEVDPGEFVVIVGPSGCGKTTLLKALDGLVEPSSGTITVGDQRVTTPLSSVGMVFQSFQLYPWRTVLENVELGLEIRGAEAAARTETATTWIERVGLEGFEDHYPAELSGGMKQRVGLARALAVDPEVLLMDEPFGALDAQTKDQMQTELLQMVNEYDKTIVFVTHDIREAILLADRVFVLSTTPATIQRELVVDFERPRWQRRLDIENSKQFGEYEAILREELGLQLADRTEQTTR